MHPNDCPALPGEARPSPLRVTEGGGARVSPESPSAALQLAHRGTPGRGAVSIGELVPRLSSDDPRCGAGVTGTTLIGNCSVGA